MKEMYENLKAKSKDLVASLDMRSLLAGLVVGFLLALIF